VSGLQTIKVSVVVTSGNQCFRGHPLTGHRCCYLGANNTICRLFNRWLDRPAEKHSVCIDAKVSK
jgi:hypothetical protein